MKPLIRYGNTQHNIAFLLLEIPNSNPFNIELAILLYSAIILIGCCLLMMQCYTERLIVSENCVTLLKDLNKLLKGEENWQMAFHPQKCKVLSVTCTRWPVHHIYYIRLNWNMYFMQLIWVPILMTI